MHMTAAVVVIAMICTALAIPPIPDNMPLGNCNPNTFTISGLGAGASMGIQFQYAWSTIVHGAAFVAGTPYLCAAGTVAGAEACLATPLIEAPEVFLASASASAEMNLIDPLVNLQNQTVFLFSGTADTVVPQLNMDNVALMMALANATERVTKIFNVSAENGWITSRYGNKCSVVATPFVNNCQLDFAGNFLRQSFSDFKISWNQTYGRVNTNNLFSFDQEQFGANPGTNSMAIEGYAYVPKACQSGTLECHLHMNLHGCEQNFANVGATYMLETQLNEWAESNNIIIIYPQAAANDVLLNPLACFDWWGYAGEDYATKTGPQITVMRYMIEHFGGF